MKLNLIDAGATIDAIGRALDSLFTSDQERLHAALLLEKLRQQPAALQTEINKIEAGHASWFVAGWRPAIGWLCACAIGYMYVLRPLLDFVLALLDVQSCASLDKSIVCTPITLPSLDLSELLTLLGGMLGLGALRTAEKLRGVARE